MVIKLSCFKASITVDMNIPVYLKDERTNGIFLDIVYKLSCYIDKNYKYKIHLCSDYNSYKIIIYRYKDDGGNDQRLSEVIRNALNNLTKIEYFNEMKEPKTAIIDYVIEFDYSNKYYLITADNMNNIIKYCKEDKL
jgi:hypothetical protein